MDDRSDPFVAGGTGQHGGLAVGETGQASPREGWITGPNGQPLRPSGEWVAAARRAGGVKAETFALFAGTNAFFEGAVREDCPFHRVGERRLCEQWIYGWRTSQRGERKRKQDADAAEDQRTRQQHWWDRI